MRITQQLYAKGFLARSMDELKRRSTIAWNLEAVKGPSAPRPLYDFREASGVNDCVLMSDQLIGGSSKSHFDYTPSSTSSSTSSSSDPPPNYARFYGSISTSLPSERLAIQRTGYAAFRTPDQKATLFGRSLWDIDPYSFLALRVKSDGRAYFVNVQTEGVEPTDLHQHRLFVKRPGQWETVLIRWNDFVRTNYGFVVEPQTEILRQKVKSIGVGLTDRVEGPFELCIESMWATNDAESGSLLEGPAGNGLKNKQGKEINWS